MKQEYSTIWDLFTGNVIIFLSARWTLNSDLGAAQHYQGFANCWHATTDVKGLQMKTKQTHLALVSADVRVTQAWVCKSLLNISISRCFKRLWYSATIKETSTELKGEKLHGRPCTTTLRQKKKLPIAVQIPQQQQDGDCVMIHGCIRIQPFKIPAVSLSQFSICHFTLTQGS